MSNPIIVLDYTFMARDQLAALADVGITDILREDWMWQTWEAQRDAPDWSQPDRWVEDCASLGIKPIIRWRGTPEWAIGDWYMADVNGNLCPNQREQFSPWCREAADCVKDRLRWVAERYGTQVIVNPGQPCSDNWANHGDPSQPTRETLYTHDRHAQKSFQDWRYSHGKTVVPAASVGGAGDQAQADVWADTVVWLNESLHAYWEEMYLWCADALDQHEAYAGYTVRPPTTFTDGWYAQTGGIDQEEWMEGLRRRLGEQACSFMPISYALFYVIGRSEYGSWAYITRELYHARRYGWSLIGGAEGAQNIVENSRRGMELGLAGLVVGSPFGGRFAAADGVREIGKAVELWRG
jgi:hypothetical protein